MTTGGYASTLAARIGEHMTPELLRGIVALHEDVPSAAIYYMLGYIVDLQRLHISRLDEPLGKPFSHEDEAAIERWIKPHFAPDQQCDECHSAMTGTGSHLFFLSFRGTFHSYFICNQCSERWESDGEAGVPLCAFGPKLLGLKREVAQ
jgi:hypothetical protein